MSTVDLTLAQVEASKVFVNKIPTFQFKEPLFYLEPFMEKFKGIGVDWSFKAEIGSQNKEVENDLGEAEQNIAYSALAVKAKLPNEFDFLADDPMFNKLYTEIGFVYNFDGQKPQIKLYRGSKVFVCTNSCVFGADNVMTMYMTGAKQSLDDVYTRTQKYVDTAFEMVERYTRTIEQLTSKVYTDRNINEKFGEMVKLGISNKSLGINPITGAIGSMLDKKSKYAIDDDSISAWKMYNSITEELKKSSILSEANKTLLLEDLFISKN